jgi:hypothetical protein
MPGGLLNIIQKEAEVIKAAHARYRFGARMLETVVHINSRLPKKK